MIARRSGRHALGRIACRPPRRRELRARVEHARENGRAREARPGRADPEPPRLLVLAFVYRPVNRDPSAMREWEQLDGESVPLLRFGKNSIVRGFDRIKVQQLIGWVGC